LADCPHTSLICLPVR